MDEHDVRLIIHGKKSMRWRKKTKKRSKSEVSFVRQAIKEKQQEGKSYTL